MCIISIIIITVIKTVSVMFSSTSAESNIDLTLENKHLNF